MKHLSLVICSLIQLSVWFPFLVAARHEGDWMNGSCSFAMVMAALMSILIYIPKTVSERLIWVCASLYGAGLGLFALQFFFFSEPMVWMLFASPAGFVLIAPPVISLFLLITMEGWSCCKKIIIEGH
jgi:hypothetical protein